MKRFIPIFFILSLFLFSSCSIYIADTPTIDFLLDYSWIFPGIFFALAMITANLDYFGVYTPERTVMHSIGNGDYEVRKEGGYGPDEELVVSKWFLNVSFGIIIHTLVIIGTGPINLLYELLIFIGIIWAMFYFSPIPRKLVVILMFITDSILVGAILYFIWLFGESALK